MVTSHSESNIFTNEISSDTLFILDMVQVPIHIIGSDGLILFCNKETETFFNKTSDKILGNDLSFFSPLYQQDGTPSKAGFSEYLSKALLNTETQFLWNFLQPGGTLAHTSIKTRQITYKNTLGLLCTIEKIPGIEKITDAEQDFRELLNSIPTAIHIVSEEGLLIDGNKAAIQLFRVDSRDDFIGKSPAHFAPLHQSDGTISESIAQEAWRKALLGETPVFEFEHKRCDGEIFPAKVTLTAVTYQGKRCFISSVIDLTRESTMLKEMHNLQKMSELVIKHSPNPIYEVGPDLQVLRFNESFRLMTGISKEELMQMKISDFTVIERIGPTAKDAIETGKEVIGEMTVAFPAGERILWYKYYPVFAEDHTLSSLIFFYTDLTEERRLIKENEKARKKAETIIEHCPISIVETGTDLSILHGNRAFSDMTGYTPEVLSTMKLSDFNVIERTGEGVADAIQKRGAASGSLSANVPSGHKMLDYTYYPLFDGDGSILEIIAFYVDVTGYKLAVKDVIALTDAAREGKLDTRVDPAKYEGDMKRLCEGINQTLDAVVNPLNIAADYVAKIAKGEVPTKITEEYHGDFNVIKKNINLCIDGLSGLLECDAVLKQIEVNDYSRSVEGSYEGVYASIAHVTNVVRERLLEITSIVKDISTGDTSQLSMLKKIGSRSDADELLPALIECMEHIRALINDTLMLSRAAVEGKLDVRADISEHQGDFREVVKGVNDTLDAVIEPLKEAMRVADAYAQADFSTRVGSNLKVAGDFVTFRDSLNNIGLQVQGAIGEITRIANAYASGDFTRTFDNALKIEGDLSAVKVALNKIGVEIPAMLSLINEKISDLALNARKVMSQTESVSSGAERISHSTTNVSHNAEQGGEGIEQVKRAMEDMTIIVSEISKKAEQVSVASEHANQISKKGIDLAQKTEKAMNDITMSAEVINAIVQEIHEQMNEIGKIVKLISDIASQTNLLALNAAIEAARAGEAGRGFAVVAAEVKSLAQESRRSAEGITDMITGLQVKSKQATEAMGDAGKAVADGSRMLDATLKSFDEIASSVDTISKAATEVASSTEEQAASAEEVTASVSEVADLIQNTAKQAIDTSTATAESAESLSQISTIIGDVNGIVSSVSEEMKKFKISKN